MFTATKRMTKYPMLHHDAERRRCTFQGLSTITTNLANGIVWEFIPDMDCIVDESSANSCFSKCCIDVTNAFF